MTKVNDGIPFRSHLERVVADELDVHLVEWGYEMPQQHPDGRAIRYLPDFEIFDAPDDLQLPRFVEAKPQQFIYDLRDDLGVTRTFGDRFSGEAIVDDYTADELKSMGIDELWKPKMLAEVLGVNVLVVGGVGGMSRLSVEMRPASIVFQRDHPFVNWRSVIKQREREREREESRKRAEEQRVYWEQHRAQMAQQAAQTRERNVAIIRGLPHYGKPRFSGQCYGCNSGVGSVYGHLHLQDHAGQKTWFTLCDDCEEGW